MSEAQQFALPFGKGSLSFHLPPTMTATLVEPKSAPSPLDVALEVRRALKAPIDSPPIAELASPGARVCIVVPDVTRACPRHLILPAVIEELESAGVATQDVTILIALGMHRPTTIKEREQMLGRVMVRRFPVVDHRPLDSKEVVRLGQTDDGIPIVVNRRVAESDLVIAIGVVEPHPHAGFSGGPKTVAIGAGGAAFIDRTHSPKMIDHPLAYLGNVEGSPFHQALAQAAKMAGLKFVVNVVLDHEEHVAALAAGEPLATLHHLIPLARELCSATIEKPFDAIIAGVGHPKDANIYQVTRVPGNLALGPRPAVKPGGIIAIAASCPEGPGRGDSEKRFYKMMTQAASPQALVEQSQGRGFLGGEQGAYVLAKALLRCRVILVGTKDPPKVKALHMEWAPDMETALEIIGSQMGDRAHIGIMPHALSILPLVAQG